MAILLALVPGALQGQAIGRPGPSALWAAKPEPARRDSTRHEGWTQSKGVLAGGLIGAVAGAAGAYWFCHRYGTSGPDGCTGYTIGGAAIFGALGVLLGALAGHDAET